MNGSLICIYGINNIGKSTQVKMLVDFLIRKGHTAEHVKYPIYELEPSGPFVNQVLRGDSKQHITEEELQLWYTLNRFQYQPTVREKIAQGTIVVAEDYTGTGLAWGAAKGGVDTQWLAEVNKPLMKEDLAILLDGDRFTEAKEEQHIHEQNDALVDRCRTEHQKLAEIYGWKVINANQDKEVAAQEIQAIVERFLGASN